MQHVKTNMMTALRAAVLASFLISGTITVFSILEEHNHTLHMLHIGLATLTFVLITVYLLKSAEIASLRIHRELRFRTTVDPGAGFIEHVQKGSSVYNACAGALAKNGIVVKNTQSMTAMSKAKTVAAEGNSTAREGYAVTESTLSQMGLRLSADTIECPVRIVLGSFDPESEPRADFTVTSDKIAHVLIIVYVCKLFIKHRLYNRVLLLIALAAAAALIVYDYNLVMYASAVLAVWSACCVAQIRQIEKKTTRLTFEMILNYWRANKKEKNNG